MLILRPPKKGQDAYFSPGNGCQRSGVPGVVAPYIMAPNIQGAYKWGLPPGLPWLAADGASATQLQRYTSDNQNLLILVDFCRFLGADL